MLGIPEPTLSTREWQAVAIALDDAAAHAPTAKRGPLSRLYTALTGNAPLPPLANPRLEAIRGFVADTRRRHRVAQDRVPALLEQGFNCRQIDALALLSA